jgi:hypothetical protein
MPQKNRTQLKDYFKTNDKPTQAQFIDLIDSMFTLLEDGGAVVKTLLEGLNPGLRLKKSAVRGADFALNRRAVCDLSDDAIVGISVVDVLKFDFWVHSGGSSPRGGLVLGTDDWVVALADGASNDDFGDPALWWIPPTVLKTAIQTLTNKRIKPRTDTLTTATSLTISTDDVDAFSITALNSNITITTTGTPSNFERLTLRIKTATSTVRDLTFNSAKFEDGTASLPAQTNGSRLLTITFEYNSVTSKWSCLAVNKISI